MGSRCAVEGKRATGKSMSQPELDAIKRKKKPNTGTNTDACRSKGTHHRLAGLVSNFQKPRGKKFVAQGN